MIWDARYALTTAGKLCTSNAKRNADSPKPADSEPKGFEVYGDSAYADGATLQEQTARGHDMRSKVAPVRNANGYSKDRFTIDLGASTVTCRPSTLWPSGRDCATASRASARSVQSCPLQADCTKSRRGRVISIHPQEGALQQAKARQQDPAWQQDYRTYRPVVERKISHFTRRPGAAETPAAADTNAS